MCELALASTKPSTAPCIDRTVFGQGKAGKEVMARRKCMKE